jgi:hypothetical protein
VLGTADVRVMVVLLRALDTANHNEDRTQLIRIADVGRKSGTRFATTGS